MKRKNNHTLQLPEEEIEKICQELSDPNQVGNLGLTPNATTLEKAKYKLCKQVLIYKQDNNLSVEELAERINLSVPETKELLFCHIDKFTLDSLTEYASRLYFPFELEISKAEPRVWEHTKN